MITVHISIDFNYVNIKLTYYLHKHSIFIIGIIIMFNTYVIGIYTYLNCDSQIWMAMSKHFPQIISL